MKNSMKQLVAMFVLLAPLPSSALLAQDTQFIFPSARDINVKMNAIVQKLEHRFQYSYELKNRDESRQKVFELYIEYASDVFDIFAPSGWNGLPSTVRTSVVMWGSSDSTYDIPPNNRLRGFSFESIGLPSPVSFYARGAFRLPEFAEGEAPDTIPGEDIFENSFVGKTIGPTVPPADFNTTIFLDTLISYKHQAFTLGWIKNQGIVTSFDAKLKNAKAQLQRNNITSARNILQSFLNEVEALNKQGNQISSEAYALLKFNTEYLVSKL